MNERKRERERERSAAKYIGLFGQPMLDREV